VDGDLNREANRVVAHVVSVLLLVNEAQMTPPQATDNDVAIAAQTAHDELESIRENEPGAFSDSGDGGFLMYDGLNELKNSMGALVGYLGDPNPATLASFSTQFDRGKSEWNEGVLAVYAESSQTKPLID
jgi:hypothetical protein